MTQTHHVSTSVLSTLRALIPPRPLGLEQALRVAELQSARLLELAGEVTAPISEEIVLSLPRIKLRHHQLAGTSGMTYWDGNDWIIAINDTEPPTRQRLTVLHEFKHIIDHGRAPEMYLPDHRYSAHQRAEFIADYFAGCVLVPRRLLKRAFYDGFQRTQDLAAIFDVSVRAMEVRLNQLGLSDEQPPVATLRASGELPHRRARYYRHSHGVAAVSGVSL